MKYLPQQFTDWLNSYGEFRAGFLSALLLLLLFIVLYFIFFLFTRKRIKEVVIPGEKGALIVSSSAIADLIKTLVSERFRCISVKKIILFRNSRGTVMEIYGSYDIDGGRLPDIIADMREAIFKNLDAQLGITSINEIVPNIRKVTSKNLHPRR